MHRIRSLRLLTRASRNPVTLFFPLLSLSLSLTDRIFQRKKNVAYFPRRFFSPRCLLCRREEKDEEEEDEFLVGYRDRVKLASEIGTRERRQKGKRWITIGTVAFLANVLALFLLLALERALRAR